MKRIGKIGLGMIFISLILSGSTVFSGDAQNGPASEFSSDISGGAGIGVQIGQKFIRGITNTFTGWVEMPKQMYLRTTQGPLAIGVLRGILEGIGMSFARTSAGLYDLATFPVPWPWHYRPLLEPEYVWQAEEPDETLSIPGLAPPAVPHGFDEKKVPMEVSPDAAD